MRQLPLGVRLRDTALFATYHPGPNAEAAAYLRRLADGGLAGGAWLWGGPATGKTHLLQAACAEAAARGRSAAFLPMGGLAGHGPGVLEGWPGEGLLALDELEAVAGDADLERALFGLYNRLAEEGGSLLVASRTAPAGLGLGLPDLRSRLAAGGVFRLEPLAEDERIEALRQRAAHRGLELPVETARFLLRRLPRDMASLCDWLERLDVAALAAQRRLTVPFVAEILRTER